MVFAYAGLLGVFLTALLTPRGNAMSAAAALVVGVLVVLALQPFAWNAWMPLLDSSNPALPPPAFPWQMAIASTIAFLTCVMGSRATRQGEQGD
jgi:SSS family solute:Na+ symporter